MAAVDACRDSKPPVLEDVLKVQLSLWCLHPACVFRQIGEQARSVLLASGTLSPMASFKGELGLPFGEQCETGHVVPPTNVRNCSCSSNFLPTA